MPEQGRMASRDHALDTCGVARRERSDAWTDQQHAAFVEMAAKKWSARMIGEALGKTRNAIIGRARRQAIVLSPLKTAPYTYADRPPRAEKPVRSACWSSRAKPEALRLEALAAFYAGESYDKVAARMPVCKASIRNWRKAYPALDAQARQIGAIRAEERAAKALREVEEEQAARNDYLNLLREINAPILAMMNERATRICEASFDGSTLDSLGAEFGITRERVRQILLLWRGRGFMLPDRQILSAGELRYLATNNSRRKQRGRPKGPRRAKPEDEGRYLAFPCFAGDASPRQRKPFVWKNEEARLARVEHMRRVGLSRRKYPRAEAASA